MNVCLCMIVRDEEKVLTSCLQSVLPWIDSWLVVDTGSVDSTPELIQSTLGTLPQGDCATLGKMGWLCRTPRQTSLFPRSGAANCSNRFPMTAPVKLIDHLHFIKDPRTGRSTYPLVNILAFTICGVIAGSDDFVAIAKYARTKKEWFATFLDLSAGIPSHDRFNAIFRHLDPQAFQDALLSWITSIAQITDGQVVAIDGKTLRGSYDTKDCRAAIHMVSAWATANHISLGHTVVDAKSNEITAIPELLKVLELAGALVTIDAMGCQVEIAAAIRAREADYCLAVKGNQPTLHQGIETYFAEQIENDFLETTFETTSSEEKAHGRVDSRRCYICPIPEDLPDAGRWKDLCAIGMTIISSERGGKEEMGQRYYILSRLMTAEEFAASVRSHWSIENNLHWQLDVTFGEDGCRVRHGHADENLSTLRRTALSLLKAEKSAGVGIKNKRLLAGWDDEYMAKVIFGAELTPPAAKQTAKST